VEAGKQKLKFKHPNAMSSESNVPRPNAVDMRESNLRNTIDALMEIVEGVHGERWAANGMQLVYTKEWCAFYVASRRHTKEAHIVRTCREPEK